MSETEQNDDDTGLVLAGDIRKAPVPKHLAKPWASIVASSTQAHVLRVIYRATVLDQPWRDAAKTEGIAHQQAWLMARRYGLTGLKDRETTVQQAQRIADLAGEEMEDRLLHSPEDIDAKQLNAAWGTAMDKLAKQWDRQQQGQGYVSALDQLASQLEGGSGTVTLQLSVQRDDNTIDVTPEPG